MHLLCQSSVSVTLAKQGEGQIVQQASSAHEYQLTPPACQMALFCDKCDTFVIDKLSGPWQLPGGILYNLHQFLSNL